MVAILLFAMEGTALAQRRPPRSRPLPGGRTRVPEIHASATTGTLALLIGGTLILSARTSRRRSPASESEPQSE